MPHTCGTQRQIQINNSNSSNFTRLRYWLAEGGRFTGAMGADEDGDIRGAWEEKEILQMVVDQEEWAAVGVNVLLWDTGQGLINPPSPPPTAGSPGLCRVSDVTTHTHTKWSKDAFPQRCGPHYIRGGDGGHVAQPPLWRHVATEKVCEELRKTFGGCTKKNKWTASAGTEVSSCGAWIQGWMGGWVGGNPS